MCPQIHECEFNIKRLTNTPNQNILHYPTNTIEDDKDREVVNAVLFALVRLL